MRSISISGVDGSGKSSQLSLLQAKLLKDGKKIFYFHAVEFSLANKIARFFKGKKDFQPGQDKATTTASWFSLYLRIKFLFVDMVRFCLLRRKLEKKGYDYILTDRFFYDSIVNIEYLAQKVSSFKWVIELGLKTLYTWMPRADKAFYLDIRPDSILSRERVPEQGKEYLESKTHLFKQKIDLWNLIPINAERTKEEVFQEILEKI